MNIESFNIVGMSCSHCVGSVTSEVSKLPGVTKVEVDLPTGTVTVESEHPIDTVAFTAAIDEAGFEVVT